MFLLAENEKSLIQQFIISLDLAFPQVSSTFLLGVLTKALLL